MRPSRLAVAALLLFAVVDVLATLAAIGHYEDSIIIFTHGRPDLPPAWFAYALLEFAEDELLGLPGLLAVVWWLTLLLALAGLYRLRPILPRLRALLVTAVLLKTVAAVHHALAAPPDPVIEGFLTTRPVAYPLWTVSTIVLAAAAWRVARSGHPDRV
ncbi:hypothetical protein [Actinoplanes sp. NPDC023714]|uniref:hypothetical protein n=1 Tax=Actinoplanes sp. NPDC023714 TaxID=3154322 RepID=UPI0033FA3810